MGAVVVTIIGALIVGVIIGPLGRLVVPGKQNVSLGITILIGAAAALVGGFIAQALGVGDTAGIDWTKLAIQVALAAVGVLLYVRSAGGASSA
ncbi:MAG: GlsB/YeaQ/YmgE family stress response membrane protein [Acidimicrobiia bacterium]|jgi:uncharacterized membrane protein YeaQ/YmgE (transglycosylase-associated protein family)